MVSPPLPRLLTHALLHAPDRPAELPRELCELEAESVAFAICDLPRIAAV